MSEDHQISILRIVDAAANRASEGLRVVEDIARMHLNDVFLSTSIKQARHDLGSTISALAFDLPIHARDTMGDVGCSIDTATEFFRGSTTSENVPPGTSSKYHPTSFIPLVAANFKRAQQALRTLEELAKSESLGKQVAKAFEQIRYQTYTLEKALTLALQANIAIPSPAVYVLVDGIDVAKTCDREGNLFNGADVSKSQFSETIKSLVAAKVDFIQLRDKRLSDRQLIVAGKLARDIVGGSPTRLIINDRADIAVAVRADGVHVGQDELTVAEVRRIVGSEMLIGVSTHSVEQAQQAVVHGASYIGIGPVFPSRTKPFDEYIGCEVVKHVVDAVSIPAFAIGGVDGDNASQLANVHCHRAAVSGLFSDLTGKPAAAFIAAADRLRAALASG